MPLARRDGSSPSTNPTMPNSQVIIGAPALIDHQPYIEDTFINKTAFNPKTYAEEYGLLQRYTRGSRISVTYFLISTPTSGLQRSDAIDPSILRNPVQTSYTLINNLELVMQDGGIKSTYDQERTETKITGTALLYPGMQPRKGDIFTTPIGDSKFGIFQVMDVERLTYRQGTNHKISFFLREYGSSSTIDVFKQSVTKTVWFDRATYLGDATTLLLEDSYLYLIALRKMRTLLTKYYYSTFYKESMSSIISPDGIYDPYLVEYINSQISIRDSTYRATQIYPAFQNYDSSIWAKLLDSENRSLLGLQPNFDIYVYKASRLSVSMTSLINHPVIGLKNPDQVLLEIENHTPSVAEQINNFLSQFTGRTPQSTTTVEFIEFQKGLRDWSRPYGFSTDETFFDNPEKSLFYVSTKSGYVLSAEFYASNKSMMTPFEFLVYAVIKERRVHDIHSLIEVYLNRYHLLTYQEQYYAIPIYLWLIDVATKQISAPSNFMT